MIKMTKFQTYELFFIILWIITFAAFGLNYYRLLKRITELKNQLDHSPQPHDYAHEIDKARRELLNIARPGLYQVIVNGKPVQVTVFGYLTAYGEYGDYRHLADYASCYDYVTKTDYLSVQDIKKARKNNGNSKK